MALSRSITTSVGLPVGASPTGGVLFPDMWEMERPDCRNNDRLSAENRLFGLRACCTKAKMSFNRLLLRFPETRAGSFPTVRRSLPVDRIRANGTRPLKELRKPDAPLLLLFDMLPSAELTEVCLSTAIGIDGWWTVAVTVHCTGIDAVPAVAATELFVAGIGYSMTVTVTAGMLLLVLLESSSVASGGLP